MALPVVGMVEKLQSQGIESVPIRVLAVMEASLKASEKYEDAMHAFCMELSTAHIALLRQVGRQSEIPIWRAKLTAALDQIDL